MQTYEDSLDCSNDKILDYEEREVSAVNLANSSPSSRTTIEYPKADEKLDFCQNSSQRS
jgi:hypothetical protein